jgi:antagonist of KipI
LLGGAMVKMWSSCEVRAGETLRMGATRDGARGYLCVRGGIAVPEVMGSASTHVLSGMGGFAGRSLRRGDVLQIGRQVGTEQRTPRPVRGLQTTGLRTGQAGPEHARARQTHGRRILSTAAQELVRMRKTLRVTAGPQSDWLSAVARRTFFASAYRVTEDSDRLGLRLAGPALEKRAPREMISEGVALGAIQVPESGFPIILFVDQQTTGGYPKIANVISADFHSLGQMRPRDEIRFELVDWNLARELLREQEDFMASDEKLFA